MRVITLIIALLLVSNVFAGNRADELKQLSRNINQIIQADATKVNEATLEEVRTLLQTVKYVMRGEGPGFVSCGAMTTRNQALYRSAHSTIDEFATNYRGMSLYRDEAADFVNQWMNQYPCDFAEDYTREMIRLIDFGAAIQHLNMMRSEAREFAIQNINKVCIDVEYEKHYNKIFYHAYGWGGLNMSTSESHEYTREIVFKEMFNCQFPAK